MNIFFSNSNKTNPLKASFNMLLLCVLLVAVFWFALARLGISLNFSFLPSLHERLADGYIMTVCLSAVSLLLSLLLGVICAVSQASRILILRYLSLLYVIVIRGTPLIVQIYLFYYTIGTAFGIQNRFLCGVLVLSIFEGAYIAEIIRGSLLSMDSTQLEAAKSVGFTKNQIITLIMLPQLTARTLPALTGQFASLIKDSSLLSVVAMIELTQTIREITSMNFKLFECYFFLGALYLSLTIPISFISKKLEQRFSYEN